MAPRAEASPPTPQPAEAGPLVPPAPVPPKGPLPLWRFVLQLSKSTLGIWTRLREEVRAFPPDKVKVLTHLQKWPRLRSVLLESMRLYPRPRSTPAWRWRKMRCAAARSSPGPSS